MNSAYPVSDQDSRQILAAALGGSRDALSFLFDRHRARLERLLALRCGARLLQRVELADLVQEAYLEAARRLPDYSYQGPDSFFRWLATVALNRMRNLQRFVDADKRQAGREQRLVGPDTFASLGGQQDATSAGPGPHTLSASSESVQQLERALSRLNEADREVILLARIEALPLDQVAQRMGRTRNAVALLLSRALRKLKASLAPDGPDRS
ncbi:MAG: sigma-70 family RNA polymerase sigma factor [Planctomycetes bacterium]|nr:sigma-70 family RNA polymerase sigma factor [Planctomycetota bacterium]MCB9889451.1 sigma-70 family RNA polymerase sigma factor [Planctomycetota bacterium]